MGFPPEAGFPEIYSWEGAAAIRGGGGELGDMDCGSRIQGPHNPVAPQLSEPQAAPQKIRRLQGPDVTEWWLVPYTRHFSTLHRTRMQTELERRIHTEQEKENLPGHKLSIHSSPVLRALLGPGQEGGSPPLHRVRLGQAPGIQEPRFLSAKRAPPAGKATLQGQLGQAGDRPEPGCAGPVLSVPGPAGPGHLWERRGPHTPR